MNTHSRPRIVALDGIYMFNPATGQHELYNPQEHYRHRRTIWAALLLGCWALVYGLWVLLA